MSKDVVSLPIAKKLKEANFALGPNERWAWVKEGVYAISQHGDVASFKRPGNPKTRMLKHWYISGYPATDAGKIHRLLAKAFIPNPNGYKCVNHIDGNPKNFALSNLEWCTYGMNLAHEYKLGRRSMKGAKNHRYGKPVSEKTRKLISKRMRKV